MIPRSLPARITWGFALLLAILILLGGGKPGAKDQVEDVGPFQRLVGLHQSAFHGLGTDALGGEPAAIVLNLDDDEASLMKSPQRDRARGRLACRHAGCGQLDAVISGVADHVNERIGEFLDQRAVELRLLTLEPQVDLLAELDCEIADQPRHAAERAANRHHS